MDYGKSPTCYVVEKKPYLLFTNLIIGFFGDIRYRVKEIFPNIIDDDEFISEHFYNLYNFDNNSKLTI